MWRSIRSRLIVSYLLVIVLAMGVAALLAWSALDRAFLDVLRENLVAQARRVAQTVEAGDMGDFGDQSAPYSQASNVLPGYHTRVIDDQGVVILGLSATGVPTANAAIESDLFSAYEELPRNLDISPSEFSGRGAPTSNFMIRSEIQSALRGEPATAVRSYSWALERRVLYAAYPIRAPDGNVVSVVYIASPLPRLTLSLLPDYFGAQILGGAVVAVALAGLVGLLLARQLVHPLRDLTDAVSALSRGEPVPPIPPASTSELHTLGTAFNTMNTNLAAAYAALAAQANQREAILNSLADAVLAADDTGEVILANPAASTLLEIVPQTFHQAIRHTLDAGEPHATEITARNQVVEWLITPLRGEDGRVSGAVAVGHDVTAYRQLDRLRTNFVSDVSHELRTPLAAIKGFVETLQDGAVDDLTARDRFLDTIALETERLIRLTNDLLLLTRADAGQLALHLAPADLVAAAERAIAQLESHALEKQIALAIETPDFSALAQADADRIHQVWVNLLDNAIKFTPPGGRVFVSFALNGEWITCTIADTGPGIPAGEIPHLFERFYRGDPSRARAEEQSGAGLGLSIARAIVEAHGGQIWIESEPGQGAGVSFTLPLAV